MVDGVISPPVTRFKWDYGGTLSTFMPPICISYHPLAYTVWIIYIYMPGPVGWKIQVKTKGCRYCMPQYKHNLIIVTGRRYRPNIKGGLLSFLHSHVCILFSHPLYLSLWVGCVLTSPPPTLYNFLLFFCLRLLRSDPIFQQCKLKIVYTIDQDQVFISFISLSIQFSHGKVFFSIHGQPGLLMYRHSTRCSRVFIVIYWHTFT